MSAIDHPPHYGGDGPLEAIEVIEAWQLGFHLGNAVKYILRAGKKGPATTDLRKALWYLRRREGRSMGLLARLLELLRSVSGQRDGGPVWLYDGADMPRPHEVAAAHGLGHDLGRVLGLIFDAQTLHAAGADVVLRQAIVLLERVVVRMEQVRGPGC